MGNCLPPSPSPTQAASRVKASASSSPSAKMLAGTPTGFQARQTGNQLMAAGSNIAHWATTAPGYNVGGAFSTTTSTFTAPADGYYSISVGILSNAKVASPFDINVVVSGTATYRINQADNSSHSCWYWSSIIALTAGQTVTLVPTGSTTIVGSTVALQTSTWTIFQVA